jgi:hypothetical protein
MPQVFACSWRQVGDVGAVVERAGRGIVVVGRIDETAYPFASNSRLAPRASQSVWPSNTPAEAVGRLLTRSRSREPRAANGGWDPSRGAHPRLEAPVCPPLRWPTSQGKREPRPLPPLTATRACASATRVDRPCRTAQPSCVHPASLLDPAASTSVQLSGRDTVVPVDEALWPVDEALWNAEQVGHLASDSTRRRLTRFSTGGGASPADFTWSEREAASAGSAPAVPPRSREQDGGEVGIECAVEGGSTGKLARMACADGHVRKGDYRSAARSPTLRRGRSKRAREEASERAGSSSPRSGLLRLSPQES